MKEFMRLVIVLTVVCAICGGILAGVHAVTADAIVRQHEREELDALRDVLPPFDNNPMSDTRAVEGRTVHVARKDGQVCGAALKARSSAGYAGDIVLLVGLAADGRVFGVRVLEQRETPGLGADIAAPAFRDQFRDRLLESTRWKVKKDGGDFDQITGATISSRAVIGVVRETLEFFARHRREILETPVPPEPPE